MGVLLIVSLFFQFNSNKYIPSFFWLIVVLISIVGILITDNLTDNFVISLVTTTIIFAIALSITFSIWYMREHTLSIHSIVTSKHEAFYWLAILLTFALGTAAGDLVAEHLKLGYLLSAVLFASIIGLVAIAYYRLHLNAVTAFWIAYILSRPLGASIGNYFSQAPDDGGLGLGTSLTSMIFLITILGLVIYLTFVRKKENTVEQGK